MTNKDKAASGGIWFGAISFISQAVSWIFTFYVIRLLEPSDYGLMTMAAFLTSYLQMFTDLGLGSAIVQREKVTDDELSSLFWFALCVGVGMGIIALLLAHPTAWFFDEPRVVPVTQLISVLFVVTALTTVPYNLLARQFEFKKVAITNLIATLFSSLVSVTLARAGYGVYTLIWANIALNTAKMLLLYQAAAWWPRWHYSTREVRPYLGYGIYLALSSAAWRLFQSLDKMVVGKLFGSFQLGIYGNAMTIASMPLDKIWPIYQQVTFPLLSRMQNDSQECNASYLQIARHVFLAISPLCLGAAMAAPELIGVVLGAKWLPMVPMFQVFCVVKLFELMTSYQVVLFNATGRHRKVFWFNVGLLVAIPSAVLLAALHSFEAVILPWLVVYPLFCVVWIWKGLRTAGISIRAYTAAVGNGMMSSLGMVVVLVAVRYGGLLSLLNSELMRLVALVIIGVLSFGFILVVFQRELLNEAVRVLLKRNR